MMNYMKGLEGCSFDQVITEVTQDGEYFTAHVVLALGSYLAGKDRFSASATSRSKERALSYALADIAGQIASVRR